MEGWIKIHKRLLDWEWADSPETFSVWIHLLLLANYEDREWHGMTVPRGSLTTSILKLAKFCGVSARSLRTSLERLKSTGEVTCKATNKYTMITICKYDDYQIVPLKSDTPKGIPADKQTTNKRQTNDTDIRNKEEKEKDIYKYISKKKPQNLSENPDKKYWQQ